MKKGILSLFLFLITQLCWAQFNLPSGKPVKISCDNAEEKVVHTALDLLSRDCKAVLSASLLVDNEQGDIIIGTVGKSPLIAKTGADLSCLKDKKQAFLLIVLPDGKLLVAGSDAHGTAYGIMELSRLIGVSPWEWWADVVPEKKTSFTLPADYQTTQSPSVEYRGIFILGAVRITSLPISNKSVLRRTVASLSYCSACGLILIGLPCTSVPCPFS